MFQKGEHDLTQPTLQRMKQLEKESVHCGTMLTSDESVGNGWKTKAYDLVRSFGVQNNEQVELI